MRRILKKVLAVSLCAALIGGTAVTLPVFVPNSGITADAADTLTYSYYNYTVLDDGSVEITKYKGSGGDVTIPSIIEGKRVTSIGSWAFSGCTRLTSITIPNNVASIGYEAFRSCTGLTSITIPDSVMSIDLHAFADCTGLTSITIGNSVTSIGDGAFEGCAGLTSITILGSVKYIDRNVFSRCCGLTSVTIGNGVTSIGYSAFYGCTELTSITIPNSVTGIGERAFSYCTGLTSVTVPDSVTSIGNWAFEGCTGLTSITIPSSVTNIGWCVFSGCTGLTSVNIQEGLKRIEASDFRDCTALTSITIPSSVMYIGDDAFYGCTKLTIYGETGSYAETYANDNGFKFVAVKSLKNTSVINSDKVQIGDKVRIAAAGNGGTAPYKYAYYYKRSTNNTWKTLGTEWGTNSSVAFAPTAEASYDIKVVVKDSAGETAEKLFTVTAVKELGLTNVSVVGRENVKLGSAVPMIGKAVGGAGNYRYSFYFKRSTNTAYKLLGEKYTTNASARFKPTAKGTYDIRIDVMDKSGKVVKKFFTATVK